MTVPKPPVVVRHGLTNTNGAGWTTPYLAIVLHIAGGSLAGADSWFDNPAARTRVNYMVGRNGTIHEYYPPESVRGYQHGIVQGNTSERFRALHRLSGYANPNLWAVGIEHEDLQQGDVSRQFRDWPAMFEASTSLSAWLCQHFAIPATVDRFLAHAEIDAINRVCCPMCSSGRMEMLESYVARVREKLGQAAPEEDDLPDLRTLAEMIRTGSDEDREYLNAVLMGGKTPIYPLPPAEHPTLGHLLHLAYYRDEAIAKAISGVLTSLPEVQVDGAAIEAIVEAEIRKALETVQLTLPPESDE